MQDGAEAVDISKMINLIGRVTDHLLTHSLTPHQLSPLHLFSHSRKL